MTSRDLLFLALAMWIPIVVSVLMFRNEPADRPFIATYIFAVMASLIGCIAVSLVLVFAGVGLGLFDGLFELGLSLLIALVAGFTIRARRARTSSFSRVP